MPGRGSDPGTLGGAGMQGAAGRATAGGPAEPPARRSRSSFSTFPFDGLWVFTTPTFLEIPSMEIILYIHYISMYLEAVSEGNEIFSHSTF